MNEQGYTIGQTGIFAFPRIPVGRYYNGAPVGTGVTTSAAQTVDTIVAMPFVVPHSMPIDRIGISVTTNIALSTMRMGLYLPDAADGMPGTLLIAHSGTLDTSTTGSKEATVAATLPRGLLWGVVQNGGASGVVIRSQASAAHLGLGRTALANDAVTLMSAARADAALPASLSAITWTFSTAAAVPPSVAVRVA